MVRGFLLHFQLALSYNAFLCTNWVLISAFQVVYIALVLMHMHLNSDTLCCIYGVMVTRNRGCTCHGVSVLTCAAQATLIGLKCMPQS